MKKILVPTDFSKNAINAVKYALALVKNEKAKIVLLHVYDIPFTDTELRVSHMSKQVKVLTDEIIGKLKSECKKIEIPGQLSAEYVVKMGLLSDTVLQTIKSKKINLVVMGTKGAYGLKEVLVGSNVATIIEKVQCPVIAVPEKTSFKTIRKITYATDYHSSDISLLKKVVDLTKGFDPDITLLHVADKEHTVDHESEVLNKFFQKVSRKTEYPKLFSKLIYGTDTDKALEAYMRKKPADLLVMSSRRRSFISRIFEKSKTKKMAFHSTVPLLALHHKKESVTFI